MSNYLVLIVAECNAVISNFRGLLLRNWTDVVDLSTSSRTEMIQCIHLISAVSNPQTNFSADVMAGTSADVVRITRQILNRSSANRTIPKQEVSAELGEMPLVLSSEVTETINLSGSYRLSSDTHADLVNRYRRIAKNNPNLSLHDYVNTELNKEDRKIRKKYGKNATIIPHYVGANGQPKYPPTMEYARSVLIVHKPWGDNKPRRRNGPTEWIEEFEEFVQLDECPEFVKLEYARVKERARSKRPEAVASEECYDDEFRADVDDEVKDLLSIITAKTMSNDPFLNVDDFKINRGLHYNWSERTMVSQSGSNESNL